MSVSYDRLDIWDIAPKDSIKKDSYIKDLGSWTFTEKDFSKPEKIINYKNWIENGIMGSISSYLFQFIADNCTEETLKQGADACKKVLDKFYNELKKISDIKLKEGYDANAKWIQHMVEYYRKTRMDS